MKEINRKEREYYSIPQVAALLGISRISVFKQVKRGDIKARKIGRGYAIPGSYIQQLSGKTLTPQRKRAIKKAVRRTIKQYGPLLIRLGNE